MARSRFVLAGIAVVALGATAAASTACRRKHKSPSGLGGGAGGDAAPAVALAIPDAAPLTGPPLVGWTPPCRVPVEEQRTTGEDRDTVRFVVDVQARADGDWDVRLTDFVLVRVNDEDMTTPAQAGTARGLVAIHALVPSWRIARDGRFVSAGIIEVDRVVKELGLGADQAARLEKTAASMTAGAGERARRRWDAWVGAWRTPETPPVTTPEGRLRHEKQLFLTGPRLLARLEQEWGRGPTPASPTGPLRNVWEAGERRTEWRADLDAATGRPLETVEREQQKIVLDSREEFPFSEQRRTVWSWDKAQGCTP